MTASWPIETRRKVRHLIEELAAVTINGFPLGLARKAQELLPDLWAVRESALPRTRRSSFARRGETKSARSKRVRAAVRARDHGCSAAGFLGIRCNGMLHMDHQWGRGAGRPEESPENCRLLCATHDRLKTDSHPTRLAWLENFRDHALSHGYADEVAYCDAQIALELAQHPEHRRVAPE